MSGLITIAIDDSANTNFLPDNEQPGVFLKRFSKDKSELNDEQIVEVWREIFGKYPQENKQFIWDSSIAYYNPKNDSIGVTLSEKVSYVVDFSPIIPAGYPMGSFLSPEPNGKQYSEFTESETHSRDEKVFSGFVKDFVSWLSVNNGDIPEIIKEVGFDFSWDEEKVWKLDVPSSFMNTSKLTWHFDVPFLWENGGAYNLTPKDVIKNPESHKEEYDRTMKADLKYPIDIMENKGRWLILDGLHRLMKASILGIDKVNVRIVTKDRISEILK